MASYNELNALIDAYINRNGVQAITGQILNGVLKAMVEQLGRGYTIMGAAIPTTDPGTPDGPECYFASTPGTYTDFDGLQVVPGELALLCYTPSDGWTKATIYEGFQQVGATIDGNVGTPSVGVSYANGVLFFDFHNMKGNPGQNGQDGQDGAAAGFGTIGADITGGVGTPGVSVESSGPATAKNLQFHFTNLKGETGVTSVVATVDNTTGTPACTVSLVGQQLTLAFSGLKGAQGDTGSSVDYPFTIVNNETTDDATKAHSAAGAKRLKDEISQLEAKVNQSFSGHLGFGDTKTTIIPTSLAPYTDAHGMVTLSANVPSYLWLCMTTPGWVAESSGIEIPMEDVGVIGGYYCYVSVEKISGVVNFCPVKRVKVKSDTDRLVITARSYAITYGDAIPTFGYTANGEVDGTPTITCQATQTSGAGIYEIVISRGTVTDENAVYENGTLVIAKAELTVRAENKYVALNGTMPAFTMQYSGFVNGEDATDLTTAPTGTTTAQGTGTAGNYPIVPSGGVSGNYNFNYVNGILSVDYCLQYVQAQLADSGSCGGFIGASGTYYGKWRTSTTYIGIILDIRRYAGATIRFVRKMDRPNLRFALLTSPTFTVNQDAAFSSAPGYDALVEITYQEGDTYNDVVIPADANYLYVYVLSEGVYVGPAAIQFRGIPAPEMEMKNLSDVTFATTTTIGPSGTVYTGTDAAVVVCSNYILANDYANIGIARFLCNNPPEGGTRYISNIAYYDPNKVFIKRETYQYVAETISDAYQFILPPSCGYMRVMVVAKNGDDNLPGNAIYFSGNDLQITGTVTE